MYDVRERDLDGGAAHGGRRGAVAAAEPGTTTADAAGTALLSSVDVLDSLAGLAVTSGRLNGGWRADRPRRAPRPDAHADTHGNADAEPGAPTGADPGRDTWPDPPAPPVTVSPPVATPAPPTVQAKLVGVRLTFSVATGTLVKFTVRATVVPSRAGRRQPRPPPPASPSAAGWAGASCAPAATLTLKSSGGTRSVSIRVR